MHCSRSKKTSKYASRISDLGCIRKEYVHLHRKQISNNSKKKVSEQCTPAQLNQQRKNKSEIKALWTQRGIISTEVMPIEAP